MRHDVLIAIRTLVKRPAYALSVVATLTLGIAGATLMFTLLDAVVLRPLPFRDPDRLLFLTGVAGPERSPRGGSFPEIHDWRTRNQTLEDVSIYDETSLNLRAGDQAVRVETEMVSASYFSLLGVNAALGRTFRPDEDAVVDRNAVAVISDALWKDRFGSAPDVLGRTIYLNDRACSIVGVMPDGFKGISFDTDVWVPSMMVSLTSAPSVVNNRGTRWLGAIARLRGSVPLARAQEDLDRVAVQLEREHPDFNRERRVQVDPLHQALVGTTRDLVLALFLGVILFLLVACANVASLQLARAAGRTRELAVRFALGARRWHVIRQLLTESIVLALVAGGFGTLLAAWALGALLAIVPDGTLPRHVQPALDARAGAFAFAISLLAGASVALLPAFAALRRNLSDAMKEGARSVSTGLASLRRPSTQQALVVVEIALAMTLLVSAGLMLRSLDRQLRLPLGFQPGGVTVARVSLPAARYAPEARLVFVDQLVERLREIPRVGAATVATSLPFTGNSSASIMMPDVARDENGALRYYRNFVTPDFFTTVGITITRGRTFTPDDRAGAPLVAIVNESGARRIWGAENPIGHRFRMGGAGAPTVEIVGIAADAQFRSLTDDLAVRVEPDVYFPFAQRTDRDIELAVRTKDGSTVPFAALQDALRAGDPGLPIYRVQALDTFVAQQTASPRFGSTLLTAFSSGALLLAAVGLYGLVAYIVGTSRREIAIRLALGAESRRVVALIVRNGMTLVAAGVALGIGGAFLAGRSLQAQLFAVDPLDPLTIAIVAALLLFVASIASVLPSRRAVRANPHTALRAD
jgi:putative ABC transport system permease protein